MKNSLDILLQQNGLNRTDFAKKVGSTEKEVSNILKNNHGTYTEKELLMISQGINCSTEQVLNQLLKIKNDDVLYVASTIEEIRQKVTEQDDEFIISGEFNSILKDVEKSTLSEIEEMGFLVGSRGSGSIATWLIDRVMNHFGSNSQLENLKSDIAKLYKIKFISLYEAKLRLKQLDY